MKSKRMKYEKLINVKIGNSLLEVKNISKFEKKNRKTSEGKINKSEMSHINI